MEEQAPADVNPIGDTVVAHGCPVACVDALQANTRIPAKPCFQSMADQDGCRAATVKQHPDTDGARLAALGQREFRG